ncbi:hypothetical protein N7468_001475 [Penicillium chermesinum]|uniref:DEAD/DEAH box helicase n=1 Tax=Penicillium chermesinum TaxID=63820 RepID=A0A9W9PJN5_9EURO|nr:uncharacterized protein N7468_001475 [Penicillium chermesinum]KAJ5246492.1 hypothetical protein N7468_001475 [Penicillium chermesinum]
MGPKKKSDARSGPGPKPGTKQAKAAAENKEKKPVPEEPKKPTVKEVIGGASWTGKLPVNMLSEHCFHLRPVFLHSHSEEIDPKTRELIILPPMKLPESHKQLALQPTALEARHFAAAFALFRVCNMRNIHLMLPPTYKRLWKEDFADIKAADVEKGDGWLYEADPFLAKQERESAALDMEKKKADHAKAQAKEKVSSVDLGLGGGGHRNKRIWSQAPKVEMGARIRREIEGLLREHTVWNPHSIKISDKEQREIIEEFTKLGFRRSHVEEAVVECKDREEVLEWLLVYVPEDDLPPWSLPENYSAGVSLGTGDLAREAKLKRLAAVGYPADLCSQVLDNRGGDELAAAEYLQGTLAHGSGFASRPIGEGIPGAWPEEQETLEAIFGERYSRVSPKGTVFRFHEPAVHYPAVPPVISIHAKGIPAYIRLSAIRRAVQYAEENFSGDPMIFNILDWLEVNLPDIMENPGRLREISTVTTSPEPETRDIPVRSARKQRRGIDWRPDSPQSIAIRDAWEEKQNTAPQVEMSRKRQSLPAWNTRDAIIDAVNSHQVTIISGETGSGKSTQSVQFILDDMIKRGLGGAANIICTQPRRISALGLADRVSDERCATVGGEVGYIIRGESKAKQGTTKITFVTTGVLLRRIQSGGDTDGNRSLDTDFLLALLRDVLKHRKDLKVILMSATLDAQIFMNYFGGSKSVGLVNIPGRTFPVQDYYLDDVVRDTGFAPELSEWDDEGIDVSRGEESLGRALRSVGMGINYELIATTVRHIDSQLGDQPGGILIFLPGTLEIERCLTAVKKIPNAHPLPLHASLLPAEQRRVIAATNVAETSITIEDVVAVIDTGRVKETSYDPKDNMVRLLEVWASQAACKQRRGRAGRVRAGTCYKLYTRKAESDMAQRPDPEIRRVPLEQLCLSVKSMKGMDDVANFLANTITPPESIAVEGRYLSMIPADLRCAKLMIYGSIFGCMESCLTIAAILTVKSPFVSPRERREEANAARSSFSRPGDGDLLTDLSAYQTWAEKARSQGYWQTQSWCVANFLSFQTLRDISSNRAQFITSLKDSGILPVDYADGANTWNRNGANHNLLRALIAGAFQPQVAQISFPDKKFASSVTGTVEVDPDARTIKYFNQENGRVFIHPSSILFSAQGYPNSAAYLSYFTKMATSKVFIRDLTPFNAYSLLLFCGSISLDTVGRGLVVDGWLRLRGWARIGVLVSRLRTMLDEALAARIDNPGIGSGGGAADRVIEAVKRLIEFNGLDQ